MLVVTLDYLVVRYQVRGRKNIVRIIYKNEFGNIQCEKVSKDTIKFKINLKGVIEKTFKSEFNTKFKGEDEFVSSGFSFPICYRELLDGIPKNIQHLFIDMYGINMQDCFDGLIEGFMCDMDAQEDLYFEMYSDMYGIALWGLKVCVVGLGLCILGGGFSLVTGLSKYVTDVLYWGSIGLAILGALLIFVSKEIKED